MFAYKLYGTSQVSLYVSFIRQLCLPTNCMELVKQIIELHENVTGLMLSLFTVLNIFDTKLISPWMLDYLISNL